MGDNELDGLTPDEQALFSFARGLHGLYCATLRTYQQPQSETIAWHILAWGDLSHAQRVAYMALAQNVAHTITASGMARTQPDVSAKGDDDGD